MKENKLFILLVLFLLLENVFAYDSSMTWMKGKGCYASFAVPKLADSWDIKDFDKRICEHQICDGTQVMNSIFNKIYLARNKTTKGEVEYWVTYFNYSENFYEAYKKYVNDFLQTSVDMQKLIHNTKIIVKNNLVKGGKYKIVYNYEPKKKELSLEFKDLGESYREEIGVFKYFNFSSPVQKYAKKNDFSFAFYTEKGVYAYWLEKKYKSNKQKYNLRSKKVDADLVLDYNEDKVNFFGFYVDNTDSSKVGEVKGMPQSVNNVAAYFRGQKHIYFCILDYTNESLELLFDTGFKKSKYNNNYLVQNKTFFVKYKMPKDMKKLDKDYLEILPLLANKYEDDLLQKNIINPTKTLLLYSNQKEYYMLKQKYGKQNSRYYAKTQAFDKVNTIFILENNKKLYDLSLYVAAVAMYYNSPIIVADKDINFRELNKEIYKYKIKNKGAITRDTHLIFVGDFPNIYKNARRIFDYYKYVYIYGTSEDNIRFTKRVFQLVLKKEVKKEMQKRGKIPNVLIINSNDVFTKNCIDDSFCKNSLVAPLLSYNRGYYILDVKSNVSDDLYLNAFSLMTEENISKYYSFLYYNNDKLYLIITYDNAYHILISAHFNQKNIVYDRVLDVKRFDIVKDNLLQVPYMDLKTKKIKKKIYAYKVIKNKNSSYYAYSFYSGNKISTLFNTLTSINGSISTTPIVFNNSVLDKSYILSTPNYSPNDNVDHNSSFYVSNLLPEQHYNDVMYSLLTQKIIHFKPNVSLTDKKKYLKSKNVVFGKIPLAYAYYWCNENVSDDDCLELISYYPFSKENKTLTRVYNLSGYNLSVAGDYFIYNGINFRNKFVYGNNFKRIAIIDAGYGVYKNVINLDDDFLIGAYDFDENHIIIFTTKKYALLDKNFVDYSTLLKENTLGNYILYDTILKEQEETLKEKFNAQLKAVSAKNRKIIRTALKKYKYEGFTNSNYVTILANPLLLPSTKFSITSSGFSDESVFKLEKKNTDKLFSDYVARLYMENPSLLSEYIYRINYSYTDGAKQCYKLINEDIVKNVLCERVKSKNKTKEGFEENSVLLTVGHGNFMALSIDKENSSEFLYSYEINNPNQGVYLLAGCILADFYSAINKKELFALKLLENGAIGVFANQQELMKNKVDPYEKIYLKIGKGNNVLGQLFSLNKKEEGMVLLGDATTVYSGSKTTLAMK